MEEKFRFGIMGAGNIAEEFCQSVEKTGIACVAAVAGRTPGKARRLAEKYGIAAAYQDYEEMLKQEKLDAVYIAATTKEIIRDGLVYDYPVVSVIEVMGRNAGWLTAAAALAKGEDCEGVDMIYLPERVFDVDKFLSDVGKKLVNNRSIVIAVSEGVKVADGRYVCELADHVDYVDAFGHKQLAGTARYLAGRVAEKYGVKTRAIELSSLQRCAAHITSRIDVTEAFNSAGAAVKAAFEGKTGMVACLKRVSEDPYMCITELAEVSKIANVEKKVPDEWITPDGTYVTAELIHYIRPLIQSEITPLWVDGLPRHLRLER